MAELTLTVTDPDVAERIAPGRTIDRLRVTTDAASSPASVEWPDQVLEAIQADDVGVWVTDDAANERQRVLIPWRTITAIVCDSQPRARARTTGFA